jgi:CubicO group peptidase (beta-lactamase class C family)
MLTRRATAVLVTASFFSLASCGPAQPAAPPPAATSASASAVPSASAAPAPTPAEKLAADTPKTTTAGNAFVAPAEWSIAVRGPMTILETPEGGSFMALIDIADTDAKDSDAAVAAAWKLYKPGASWPLKVITPAADKDGWTDRKSYLYQTSPNERRDVDVDVRKANGVWTLVIYDMAQAVGVGGKRGAQVHLVYGTLLPKGRRRESFAGKTAHKLDDARIAALTKFVTTAMEVTKVPGVSLALYQDRKVVFSGGFGVRQLGKPDKVDGDTRYLVASNTKAMATLMLAKLVDAKKIAWDSPAVSLLPQFKLGDPDTTKKVEVKHLICACTGMPRQDMEWLLEFKDLTADRVLQTLGTMQPTSKFGELFQYSNPMAAAAGFLGGHVAHPKLELGAAFDKAMQDLVFDPLEMKSTTLDLKKAQQGNVAVPHAPDADGKPALAEARVNLSIVPVRPAGGAWSTVNDVMKYVAMELADGKLPDGKEYIGKDALLARRAPQVAVSSDVTYGMGLMVDKVYGVPVVHHGGDMIGFHSDMMWLPEHGVGAVILTNGDPGWLVRTFFRRKLLEVLFDGNAEADSQLAAEAKTFYDQLAAERKLLTIPADAGDAGKLLARYANAALGEIAVKKKGPQVVFDFGEWPSEVGSRKNPDGTTSFLTVAPGIGGLDFVVGGAASAKRTLTLRDAQHEYVFDAK